jgi:hypothetical protein
VLSAFGARIPLPREEKKLYDTQSINVISNGFDVATCKGLLGAALEQFLVPDIIATPALLSHDGFARRPFADQSNGNS